MSNLEDQIASSQTQIAGYRIQPYKPMTDQTAYGNRNMSPIMALPPVNDVAHTTAPAGNRLRGNSNVTSTPKPLILSNGASAAAGNNSPRRG